MKTAKIINILKKELKTLQTQYSVKSLYLFGSASRNEAKKNSDIDILVEFSNENITFFEFLNLKEYLELKLNAKVDLVTKKSVLDWMIADIEKDSIRVA